MNNYLKLTVSTLFSIIFTASAFANTVESASGELIISNNLKQSDTILYTSVDKEAIQPGKLNEDIIDFVGKNNLEKTISIYSDEKKRNKVCDINFDFSDNSFAEAQNQSFISMCSSTGSAINCFMVEYPINKITIENNSSSQYYCKNDSQSIDEVTSTTPQSSPAGSRYFQVEQFINVNVKTQ